MSEKLRLIKIAQRQLKLYDFPNLNSFLHTMRRKTALAKKYEAELVDMFSS